MAKKRIKRILKGASKIALPMLAVAGLGRAFMNNRNRRAMLEGADANEGFREMFMRPNMLNIAGRSRIKPTMMTAEDMANDPMFLNAMKKGGRVKKTKGFSKTKKKQANKMRKK